MSGFFTLGLSLGDSEKIHIKQIVAFKFLDLIEREGGKPVFQAIEFVRILYTRRDEKSHKIHNTLFLQIFILLA